MAESEGGQRSGRAGRPSVATERRGQIIDAFIRLVASHGLEGVGLDDVAAAAGMKRPALRHFVGNRDELIAATVDELRRRYEATVRALAPERPTAEALIRALFSEQWVRGLATEDAVFSALLHEATRDGSGREDVRRAYDVLLDALEEALRRDHPAASVRELRDAAYAIACLVEHNTAMQRLGYPRARSAGALTAALRLARQPSPGT
jgi:AcrR family transcriptional regulator